MNGEGIKVSLPYKGELVSRARELRKQATPQENRLWYDFLRLYPVRFQRQKVISGFIADFYCHTAKLVIEIDGTHHETAQGKAYDKERSAVLQKYDIEVLRFSNTEIENIFPVVCEKIHLAVQKRIRTHIS